MSAKKIVSWMMRFLPVDKKLVIFESSDYGDNSKNLCEELVKQSSEYKIVWIVKNPEYYQQLHPEYIFLSIKDKKYNLLYRWRAKYCFFTHNFVGIDKKKNQVRCFMTHGLPMKNCANQFWNMDKNTDILATSEEAADIAEISYGGGKSISRYLGYPRNDDLFKDNDVRSKLSIDKNQKLILWMPTFKRHISDGRNDMSIERSNDIYLLKQDLLEKVNEQLREVGAYLLIKFHPYQAMEYVTLVQASNIISMTNTDLANKNISVYQLLAASDALITDFSSVYVDYLLCDKPIGFDLTDLDNYALGFSVPNPLDYLPGDKIYSEDDFMEYIKNVLQGNDVWSMERKNLTNRMYKYPDGNSSKRVLEYFHLI